MNEEDLISQNSPMLVTSDDEDDVQICVVPSTSREDTVQRRTQTDITNFFTSCSSSKMKGQ